MKELRVIVFLLLCIVFIPIQVHADTMKELPPYITVKGIDTDKYKIEKEIKEEKVVINIKERDGNLYYSWSFDKDKVGEEIDLNFELNFISPVQSKIDSIAENKDKTYLSFTHHGTLPSEATINVYVGNKYSEGEKLYLYYYNDEKDVVEYVEDGLTVKDGYVQFKIHHCSDYFLTGAVVNNAEGNPKSMNYAIGILAIIVIGLIGANLFFKR